MTGRERARTIEALDMRCDKTEMPDSLGSDKADGYWVGIGTFSGRASELDPTGSLGVDAQVASLGSVAIAVDNGCLYAIVAPPSVVEPAVWLSVDTADVNVAGSDVGGLLRKKPRTVSITVPGGELVIQDVARVFRSSGAFQSGQASSLIEILTA